MLISSIISSYCFMHGGKGQRSVAKDSVLLQPASRDGQMLRIFLQSGVLAAGGFPILAAQLSGLASSSLRLLAWTSDRVGRSTLDALLELGFIHIPVGYRVLGLLPGQCRRQLWVAFHSSRFLCSPFELFVFYLN